MAAKVLPLSIGLPPARVDGFAWYPYDPAMFEYLKVKGRFGDVAELGIKTADGIWLAVPRAICPEPTPDRDFRAQGSPIECAMSANFVPRENQLDILPQIDTLVAMKESFILQAGTGIGKTAMSMKVVTGHKTTTLVVVDQENILEQWQKAIIQHTTICEHEIGFIQGDVCDVKGKKIVIAMLQSIYKKGRYPAWVYRYFGLIIFDECHILGAAEFSKVCGLFPARIRLGLSATPNRQDGMQKVFICHIGPVAIKKAGVPLRPKVLLVDTGFRLPIVRRRDPNDMSIKEVQLPHSSGRLMEVYKCMAKDYQRNKLIALLAAQAYNAGRKTVIFTDLKDDHQDALESALIGAGVAQGDIGRYTGGLDSDGRDYASAKRVVLATYKATSKAVDCPWWDTAIMGTPHSDVEQIVGRVLREHPTKQCVGNYGTAKWNPDPAIKVPVVFDLVDLDSTVLCGYTRGRLDYYKKVGAVIGGDTSLVQQVDYRKGNLLYAPK